VCLVEVRRRGVCEVGTLAARAEVQPPPVRARPGGALRRGARGARAPHLVLPRAGNAPCNCLSS